ncbi:MAG: hypothetical protein IT260_18980, partial [Saprospiraceae bacterium]|nr:hypothetical protein [Saprospiraceae bacterium]
VKGLSHQIQAPPSFPGRDTITVFSRWENGSELPDTVVFADAALTTLRARYEDVVLTGTGAYGMYFTLRPDTTFDELVFSRIDTTIQFSWGDFPPDARLAPDLYGVRWLGAIEPLISEIYYFHVDSDDGFRLWVDGQKIAEAWHIKGPGEITGGIYLEKGKKYPFRLDYFEYALGASAKLLWSSASTPKQVIPRKRLFPRLPENPGDTEDPLRLSLQPNPVHNLLGIRFDTQFQQNFHLRLFDTAGRMVREWRDQRIEEPQHWLFWPVADLQSGIYWMELEPEGKATVVQPFVKM